MNIVYCFTPDWAKYIPTQIHSFLHHNPGEHDIYFILKDHPNNEDELAALSHICTIHLKWLDPQDTLKFSGRFSEATMYRLYIPELIFSSRCLYLDADTIVTGDLSEFYNQQLAPSELVVGVTDRGITPKRKAKIKLQPYAPYVNGGVLLLNLDAIRERKIDEQWIQLARTRHFPCNDQDIINITCQGGIRLASPKYNSSISTGFVDKPAIVHYAGIKNPWVDRLPMSSCWHTAHQRYLEWQRNSPSLPPTT